MRRARNWGWVMVVATALIGCACAAIEAPVPDPTPRTTASAGPTATEVPVAPSGTAPGTPVAPPAGTPPSAALPTVAPPSTPPPTTPPPPTATTPPGRAEVPAPIERVEVSRGAGDAAIARITSGLPSGCAQYSRAVAARSGNLVTVDVYNHQPTGNVACTAIYGIVTNDVQLGGGFASGVAYAIEVNGTRQSFTLR